MKFTFGGGAQEVGASCIYFEAGGKGILMDAGIRQSGTKDKLPDFFSIQQQGSVDVILISHAHMDHIGSLPLISRMYPGALIYMTAMTRDLARVLLLDGLKIMNQTEEEIPFYNEQDMQNMFDRVRIVKYLAETEVLPGIKATYFPAGHVAGAACINIETPDGTVFYTGDYSLFTQQTVEGARIPRLRPDIAITETTYGSRMHSNRQAEENRFVTLLAECIRQNMKILIPAFALGRAQEVLLLIRSAMLKKQIPEIPVWCDGMVRDMNQAYKNNPTFLREALARRIMKGQEPFYTDNIQPVLNSMDRNELYHNIKGSCIFVASSGMLTGGPSVTYAQNLITDENACIILTGYQDEESPGRALLNLAAPDSDHTITLNNVLYTAKCRVEIVGLSAHADKMELLNMMDKITPRNIILVHGDGESIDSMSDDLSQDYRRRIYVPAVGETIDIPLRSLRKQNTFRFNETLHLTINGEEDLMKLRTFWLEHYQRYTFTIEQVYTLLTGTHTEEEEELAKLQKTLLESPYFTTDRRRLFLIRPATEEEILEEKKANTATIQDVESFIRSHFPGNLRKISYFQDRQAAAIVMDFPDVVNREEIDAINKEMNDTLGWTVSLSDTMNHTAANTLLQALFASRLKKSSIYLDRKAYSVKLSTPQDNDAQLCEQFQKLTGWRCLINETPTDLPVTATAPVSQDDAFVPSLNRPAMEQNAALSAIDIAFFDAAYKPYKKGLKSDAHGRYMELSFITPAAGRAEAETIQKAADQTGWRMKIADKANQNILISTAASILAGYGIIPAKVPSYIPADQSIAVFTNGIALPEEAVKEFYKQTCTQLRSK